ncbi:MAG: DUF3152 domain-containing protein [Candidatus Saccharibacteria bacterium]|nr:DUF3152 domain-containing protein [Candidatus Saccharibacteria bacterium]
MLEGALSLIISAEVERANLEAQKKADSYYTVNVPVSSYKYNITYDVSYRGDVKADKAEFAKLVDEILNDERGWKRAGVKFTRVESGGRLHMVLASGAEVRAAAPYDNGCSALLSCTVKPYVLINDDRWLYATDSYNELGVSLLSYRQMVVNHEVGHFLGHGHISQCETAAGPAPIMLQQSTGLRGCTPNSWPLPSELWVKGI